VSQDVLIRTRTKYRAVLLLAPVAAACSEVGPCEGPLEGRDTAVVNGAIVYGGQAIVNKTCATGCHLSTATGEARRGAPAGLDFDLIPVDEASTAGLTTTATRTFVQLQSAQAEGLRKRQKLIVEQRDSIWEQVVDGHMPPNGTLRSLMATIFASTEAKPCQSSEAYSAMPEADSREVLRNWLACGAPFVETHGAKLPKSSAAGTVGDQYRECSASSSGAASTTTLETLFITTLADCGGCHNNALTGPPAFADVPTLAASLRTRSVCGEKPFVTPGDPANSYLLDLLRAPNPRCNHQQMPAGGLGPLSARGIASVEAWIAAGAPTTAADLATGSAMPSQSPLSPARSVHAP
jgi:cytochrome c553